MKRMVLMAAMAISGCSGGGSEPGTAALEDSLVGTWKFVYEATQCEELYEFYADGRYEQSSLDERLVGSYTLTGSGDRKVLTVAIDSDNEMSDCEGDSADNSGDEASGWVEIEATRTYMFDGAAGGDAYKTNYRVE